MDVEIEQPHLAHEHLTHQHPTRHWIDYAVPISALFISMISIFVAWEHGQVMKQLVDQNAKMVRANSLPYIELSNGNFDPTAQKPRVSFSVINRGVGPAQIYWAQVLFDGHPVDARQLLLECCGGAPQQIEMSSLSNRMVQAGQEIRYLALWVTPQSKPAADALFKAYGDRRMATKVCYCSLFNECWIISSTNFLPTPVRECAPVNMTYEGTPSRER